MVVEDDHASLISGAPSATVTTGRRTWAVIRSMSKAMGPDLRFAVMISDQESADRVQGRLLLGPGWVSHFVQNLVARLLTDTTVLAACAHAEQVYTERRTALLAALSAHGVAAHGRSGLNVLIPVPEESPVTSHLMAQGWAVRSGETFRLRCAPFVRVTTARLPPQEAPRLAEVLAAVLTPAGRRRNI